MLPERRRASTASNRKAATDRIHMLDDMIGRSKRLAALFLIVFSLVIYAGAFNNEFVWDDEGVFLQDPRIRDLGNVPAFFLSPLVLGKEEVIGEGVATAPIRYYRPLLSALHAAEFQLFGENPFGYHALNVLLNALVVVAAFYLVAALTGHAGVGFLAALLYAANPARGEVVYWAYSDSHILTALFSLLALLAWHHRKSGVALGCFAAALLFQESAILLPAVLLGYEALVRQERDGWAGNCRRLLPFVAVAGAYLLLRHLAAGALPVTRLELPTLLRAIPFLILQHLKIFFVPDGPATVYLYQPGMFARLTPAIALACGLAVALAAVAVALWRLNKGLLFWYGWFFVWIALAFNVGSYGDYLMNEKSLYLAALGPCMLLARLALAASRLQAAGVAALLLLAGFHASETVVRDRYWSDTETYLQGLLAFEPDFSLARVQLGGQYRQAGRYQEAAEQYAATLRLRPDIQNYVRGALADTYLQLAQRLVGTGDYAGALAVLESSLRQVPEMSNTHNGIGVVHAIRGDMGQAAVSWEEALRLDPKNAEARSNLQRFDLSNRIEESSDTGMQGKLR